MGTHASELRLFPKPGPITLSCSCFLTLSEVELFLSLCLGVSVGFRENTKEDMPLLDHFQLANFGF